MAFYVTHEAGLTLPAGWVDASINRLEYDRPGGTIRIGITRQERGKRDLETCASERLVEQRRGLPSFELLGRSSRVAGGVPAADLQVAHEDAAGKTYHRTLLMILGEKVVLLVVSGPAGDRASVDAIFERAAATVEVRAPSPEG